MIQFMSDPEFDIEQVYTRIQNLKKMKTKLSLRTYTNVNFYKDIKPINGEDEISEGFEDESSSEQDDDYGKEQYCPKAQAYQDFELGG